MTEQYTLNLSYEGSDNYLVCLQANEAVEEGEFNNWDHAYETLWDLFESELEIGYEE
jgi:hypothetical protein